MTLANTDTGEIVLTLDDLEEVIERGLATFVEVGEALKAIRDSRLYRQSFDTFEEYCQGRWGLARNRAYQLMEAAEVSSTVSKILDTAPSRESHAAALAPLKDDPDAMAEAWTAANEKTDGKPTAADVTAEVKVRLDPPKPAEPAGVPGGTPEPSPTGAAALDAYLEGDADIEAAKYRQAALRVLADMRKATSFDAEVLAPTLSETDWLLWLGSQRDINAWFDRLTKARPNGLRLMNGGKQ